MNSQRGNVLFLILIAVALFAALSYAVTSSTRSSGGSASREKTAITAANILDYASELNAAMTRMRVTNNCTYEQISFDNPSSGTDYNNPAAPADFRCHLFRSEGGGAVFRQDLGTIIFISAAPPYVELPSKNVLFLVIELGTSQELCDEINNKMGFPYTNYNSDSGGPLHSWNGSSSSNFAFSGANVYEPAGCLTDLMGGPLLFINTLMKQP